MSFKSLLKKSDAQTTQSLVEDQPSTVCPNRQKSLFIEMAIAKPSVAINCA
ncbi:hypothetical protein [Nostoc sp.]|uniref:hypothetical protein n=1 Tax=Nostoc sp. TaxID=1180 RepID=UPI002FF9D423